MDYMSDVVCSLIYNCSLLLYKMNRASISDLPTYFTNNWQVDVLISRAWTSFNPKTNRILSFNMILSDAQGSSIHAKIPSNLLRLFQKAFKEGCVYRIRKFVVYKYSIMYHPLQCDIYIQFLYSTSITTCPTHPSVFRRYVFDFLPFNMLADRVNDDKYLTDVIGVLREWGSVQYQLESVSSCNPGVNVSLWGHLVNQFTDDYIRRNAKNTDVIILSSCKVRSYKGMVESPQITINEDNAATFQITSIANIYSLFTAGDVAEGTIFNIDANISGVEMHSDWKYVKCNKCRKKASMVDPYYFCWNCEEDVVNPRHVYKLELCVTNGINDEMTCVLFNEAAVSLLKINADELVNKFLSEGVDDPNWIESYLNENLCSRRVIFVIKIDAYNLAPKFSSRFTVSKYLGDDINVLIQPRSISTTVDTANPPSTGVLQIDEETEMCAKIKDVEWEMADEVFSSLVDNSVTPSKQSSVIVGNGSDASLTQSLRSISTTVDAANPPSAGVLQIDEETEMCAKIKDVEWEMDDEVFSSLVDNSVTPSTQSSIIGDNKTVDNHLQSEVEVKLLLIRRQMIALLKREFR
ncbi:putative nucleic acid-binding, replication factor A [Helianthus annuus]|nr:putative nucleic acid-binding, replication factor A [Helianthus annuus]